MSLPPGPSEPAALQTWQWIRRPMEFLSRNHRRFGEIFTMRILYFGQVVQIGDPETIRDIFASPQERMDAGQANAVLKPFLGAHSLLVLDGAEHQRQRRLIMPAFHGDRMTAYGQIMLDLADQMIDALPLRQPVAMHEPLQRYTLQIILRTVFGIDDRPGPDRRAVELTELLRQALELATMPGLLLPPLQRDLFGLLPWGRFLRLLARGDVLLAEEMAERRKAGDTGQSDILSLLLQARDEDGRPLSDAELRDQLLTLLVAGHETTATALCWALRWLLATPAVCARLQDELRGALDEAGKLVPDRVARLPYLDATVREALRLQPVVPLVGRVLKQPITLLGHELPVGTVVAPSIVMAHRRQAAYPDPLRFQPERFLSSKLSAAEYLPFGGGPRRCVGAAFAQYEMKLALAAMLTRLQLELEPGYDPQPVRRAVTLTPSRGLPVVIRSRLASRA